jgi:hypothetical protein
MKKIALFAVVVLFAACGKKAEAPAPAAGGKAPAAEAAKAAPAAPAGLAIAKLNLKIDAPAGSEISDMMGSQMIQGPGLVVTVKEAGENDPKTLADQKKESEMYTPTNGKEENLPDGWLYTFENKGDAGANYWVVVSRTIGGKTYRCETTSSSTEQQANAVKACKSLRQ